MLLVFHLPEQLVSLLSIHLLDSLMQVPPVVRSGPQLKQDQLYRVQTPSICYRCFSTEQWWLLLLLFLLIVMLFSFASTDISRVCKFAGTVCFRALWRPWKVQTVKHIFYRCQDSLFALEQLKFDVVSEASTTAAKALKLEFFDRFADGLQVRTVSVHD